MGPIEARDCSLGLPRVEMMVYMPLQFGSESEHFLIPYTS